MRRNRGRRDAWSIPLALLWMALSTALSMALLMACSGAEPALPDGDIASSETPTDSTPARADCREPGTPFNPLLDPIRLPCQPTKEPCDGIDNDQDGFLDPHCPSVPCNSDSDCTYGGLLPDADCNDWEPEFPGCNQIDGAPLVDEIIDCQGMLCPPGLKCLMGECIQPGTKMPREECTSGAECPINAGCIPQVHRTAGTTVCVQFCHETPCPDGYACITPPPGAELVSHSTCFPLVTCPKAFDSCAAENEACLGDPACSLFTVCRHQAPLDSPGESCEGLAPKDPASAARAEALQKCEVAICGDGDG